MIDFMRMISLLLLKNEVIMVFICKGYCKREKDVKLERKPNSKPLILKTVNIQNMCMYVLSVSCLP